MDEEPILTKKPVMLELMSVDELQARIVALREAIAACEAEIDRKQSQKRAADALFGGKS
jgi:uncharacterized small protein (DUF1192 family)